jgi:hypothetical protein
MPPAEVETCTSARARNGPVFLFYIPYIADSAHRFAFVICYNCAKLKAQYFSVYQNKSILFPPEKH